MRRLRTSRGVRFGSVFSFIAAGALLAGIGGELIWSSVEFTRGGSQRTMIQTARTIGSGGGGGERIASGAMFTGEAIFKPFVFVALPAPEAANGTYTLVEDAGVHMNDNGDVVATYYNDYEDENHGFVWFDDEYAAGGWGTALATSSGPTTIVLDDAGLSGINDDLEICGTRDNSGPEAFYFNLTSPGAREGSLTVIAGGMAYDINSYGAVVGTSSGSPIGWADGSGEPAPLPALPSATTSAAYGLTPNTPLGDSIIVGQSEDANSDVQAVVWENDSGWSVSALSAVNDPYTGGAIDVNDDEIIIGYILNDGSLFATTAWYFDMTWVQVGLDVDPVFFPEAINDEEYPEVVGEQYLWKFTDIDDGLGQQLDLTELTLGLPDDWTAMRCTDINNHGEIVGVLEIDGGDPVAFKLVPYDVNNNGEPDFREIIEGDEYDTNGNWLIDWGENVGSGVGMRVGLHTPGSVGVDGGLDPVQIVRLKLNIAPRTLGSQYRDPDEAYIDEIVSNTPYCESCEDFTQKVNDWGTGAGRPGALEDEQVEILVRVHSMLGETGWGKYEGLPGSTSDHDEALEDLESFGYRFAHCIDYLQWGNESFGGAGGYKFRQNKFSCDPFDDGKLFQELPDNCKQLAIDAILDWQEEQMWAALRGSALAGRPLRMTSCGIKAGLVNNSYDETGPTQDFIIQVCDWCNDNQMYFSMHVHYFTVDDALDAITKLVDTYEGVSGAPWDVPNWRICTEVGTEADFVNDAWWTDGVSPTPYDNLAEFVDLNGNPPEDYYWEDLINDWEEFGDNFSSTGFAIDDVMGTFAESGFAAICWTALQFGSTDPPGPFLVEALRADKLGSDDFTQYPHRFTQYPHRFTPIADAYIAAGADYKIDPDEVFLPHTETCDCADTCGGCNCE